MSGTFCELGFSMSMIKIQTNQTILFKIILNINLSIILEQNKQSNHPIHTT